MKKILIFLILGIVLSHCDEGFENPHYPIEASIEFKTIEFIETLAVGDFDTLKLKIKYRDGDSDLGLGSNEINNPYQNSNYFLEDGSGATMKVTEEVIKVNSEFYISLIVPPTNFGKLVTDRTRLKSNYDYLPEYDPNSCLNYNHTQLLVSEASEAIDDSYNILDTINFLSTEYFLIEEALLYERNENFNNIFIEFYISDDGTNFTEFNWFSQFCIDFNSRFPLLLDYTGKLKSGPFTITAKTPWEGLISFSMPNSSFKALFQSKKLKLKIKIKDRALHTSNIIETPVFTLDEIKKK